MLDDDLDPHGLIRRRRHGTGAGGRHPRFGRGFRSRPVPGYEVNRRLPESFLSADPEPLLAKFEDLFDALDTGRVSGEIGRAALAQNRAVGHHPSSVP